MMLCVPEKCARGLASCRPLSDITSDCGTSFICCGENNGRMAPVAQDRYTLCFKGPHRDDMSFHDKRDLVHHASVILRAVAVIEKDVSEDNDWSPWDTERGEEG